MTTGREMTPIAAPADPAAILREFQRRRKELERRWALPVATMLFPGVLAFGLAAEFLPDQGALQIAIIVGSFLLVGAGVVRGFSLMNEDRRCPKCDRVQELGFCTPYRTCACGCRLSEGWRDSW